METVRVTRYENGHFEDLDDHVITETRISIHVEGTEIAGLMALPEAHEALAVGFLLSDGYVTGPDDIASITSNPETGRVNITLSAKCHRTSHSSKSNQTMGSSKGIFSFPAHDEFKLPLLKSRVCHRVEEILAAVKQLSDSSILFKNTGGVHSSGLWMNGRFMWMYDDIGRHNAVDKVIGRAVMDCWPMPENACIVSTGRISSDIVCKLLRARIPVLVSRSAPTGIAIQIARQHGLTLIGFARNDQCNIYTHPERLTASD